MTTPAETIASKLEAAISSAAYYKEALIEQATAGKSAANLNNVIHAIAKAEGEERIWARLSQAATYHGEEFTPEIANRETLEILAQGADDEWSGRGNDLQRSRFDGVRKAAAEVEYLFS